MLSGDPRKWSTPQKEHAEGRTRPACARRPPRARADRTTVCAACRTDDAGSDGKLDLLGSGIHGERAPDTSNSAAKSLSPCWPKVVEATGAGVSENLIGSAD